LVEDAEHLVSEPPVEVGTGLEAEGVEVDVPAAALARDRLGGLEQLRAPAVATAVLVHPEELDMQPPCPEVAQHAAADAILLVAQEDRDRTPVGASRDHDVPAVEAVADRLLIGGVGRVRSDETQRHRAIPAAARDSATISSARRHTGGFAACST